MSALLCGGIVLGVVLTTLLQAHVGFNFGFGDPNAYDPTAQGYHMDISAVPVVGYNSDDGFGAGVLGGFYWRNPNNKPYKFAIEGILYITTLAVHADGAYFDWLRVNDWPLRFIGGVFFWATHDDTYCGFGNNNTCADAGARQAVQRFNIPPDQQNSFIHTYYLRRYINPSAELKLFYEVYSGPPKLEVTLFWRGSGYIPGVLGHTVPYPNNLYNQVFPSGEPGFASVFQLGVMTDTRDKEAAPTQGYWMDASVRGSSKAWGSSWEYAGFNASVRTYLSLDPRHTWVWANRVVGDFILGTPSVAEYSQVGGYATVPGGLQGFGGSDIGRGIRQNRYIGRIRVMDQTEVRWTFVSLDLFGEHFDLTAVVFADAAWVGVDYRNFGGDPRKIILGEGGGLRIAWDEDFMIRIDAAVASVENFDVRFYVSVDNVF